MKILIRATNWVGDAVMSLPAIRAVRDHFPTAEIAVLARPWVADLYARETAVDRVIPYTATEWRAKFKTAMKLRAERFACAVLFQNAFEAAVLAFLARIPRRIGYNRDARGWLLTDAVPVPKPGELPRHERYYYLEMLRRAGLLAEIPGTGPIRLEGSQQAGIQGAHKFREAGLPQPVIGVSPGAAYGNAKRWFPARFAESAAVLARQHGASIAIFGSGAERPLCDAVAERIGTAQVRNFAGQTSLRDFIEMAAACRLFLTNDSGAMHIASALGVPTVTIFGATDDTTTGPTGDLARVVREPVECSPCLLRECPIDHRCMSQVTVERVIGVAEELWEQSGH